jgi:hypothetical protein
MAYAFISKIITLIIITKINTQIFLYKISINIVLLIFLFIISFNNSIAGAGSKEIEDIQIDKNPLTLNEDNIFKDKKTLEENWVL